MSFSVIIPTKNRSEKLKRALASVVAQTMPPREIVVVDDGSSPEEAKATAALVAATPNATLLRQAASSGGSHARNLGVAASRGDLIAFLDSDDWWAPSRLEAHSRVLLAGGAALSYNPAYLMRPDENETVGTYGRPLSSRRPSLVALAAWNFIGGCSSVCVTRAVFEEVAGFDTRLASCQDWNLWLRIAGHGTMAFVPKPLTYLDIGPHERITTSRAKVEDGHRAIKEFVDEAVTERRHQRYVRAHQKWVQAELAARFGEPRRALRLLGESLIILPTTVAASRAPSLLISGITSLIRSK